jgi:hypothetical protein
VGSKAAKKKKKKEGTQIKYLSWSFEQNKKKPKSEVLKSEQIKAARLEG